MKAPWPADIVRGFWTPAWAVQLDLKLNHIHADQEKIMAQGDDLKVGWEAVKKEVAEAVAKFNEIKAKLDAALADDADVAALKTAATEVSAEMAAVTQNLDEAFGTQFTPSGQ